MVAPPAHSMHAVWAVVFWYLPEGQSLHVPIAASSAYLPALQSTQVLPALRCLPATHSEQKVWLVLGWYLPTGHMRHEVAPLLALKCPAAHTVHVSAQRHLLTDALMPQGVVLLRL